ncbi:hypothetical protein ACO2KH_18320 [Leptospira terpstrae]|uniref:hypothetical protein n=1 Tax=Leptospira terpstrae TaxID=293075 RepID=UPI003CFFCC8C
MKSRSLKFVIYSIGFSSLLIFFKTDIGSCEPCELISFNEAAAFYILLKEDEAKLSIACIDNNNSRCIEFNSGSYNSNSNLCKLYIPNSDPATKCENYIAKCKISKLSSTIYYLSTWNEINSSQNCRENNGEYLKI